MITEKNFIELQAQILDSIATIQNLLKGGYDQNTDERIAAYRKKAESIAVECEDIIRKIDTVLDAELVAASPPPRDDETRCSECSAQMRFSPAGLYCPECTATMAGARKTPF